ncbi:MAG: type II toxin-antitoxin system HicB family antitoxin [Dehalococcoidia bacterium]
MFADYVHAAMHRATYELLEDGTFFGSIPGFQGVWSNADTLEVCRDELAEVLEDWILLGIWLHHELPVIDGLDLNLRAAEVA